MVQKLPEGREFEAELRHPMTVKLSLQPSSECVPFSNQGRVRQRRERDGLRFSSAIPKMQWDSNTPLPLRL